MNEDTELHQTWDEKVTSQISPRLDEAISEEIANPPKAIAVDVPFDT